MTQINILQKQVVAWNLYKRIKLKDWLSEVF